jgi:hypothetical protein
VHQNFIDSTFHKQDCAPFNILSELQTMVRSSFPMGFDRILQVLYFRATTFLRVVAHPSNHD